MEKSLYYRYTIENDTIDGNGISIEANGLALGKDASIVTTNGGLAMTDLSHTGATDATDFKVGPSNLGVYLYTDSSSRYFYTDTIGSGMLHQTNDSNSSSLPTIEGQGIANSTITLSLDKKISWQQAVQSDGYWASGVNQNSISSLGIGKHTLTVTALDKDKNEVSTTRDIYINAQGQTTLAPKETGWGSDYLDAQIGTGGWEYPTLTYSFATPGKVATLIEENGKEVSTTASRTWTDTEKQAFRDALQAYSNISKLKFVEADYISDNPNTPVNETRILGTNIVATWCDPSTWGDTPEATRYTLGDCQFPELKQSGQITLRLNDYRVKNPTPGDYSYETIVHELGHGLGLSHPHDGTQQFPGVPNGEYKNLGDYELNYGWWTIMSYNLYVDKNGYGLPMTPMLFDVAALQKLYGANQEYRTGNDTYAMTAEGGAGTGWTCIWDAGGNDTISFKDITTDCQVSLRSYPVTGGVEPLGFSSRTVSSAAKGFMIADNAIIENAIGGKGNDKLYGNAVSNQLTGGEGKDAFYFTSALSSTNIDTILDFDFSANEQLALSKSIFTAFKGKDANGAEVAIQATADNLRVGKGVTSALDANDFLIYDNDTGALYYDQDGSGNAYTAQQFATLATRPSELTAPVFLVI